MAREPLQIKSITTSMLDNDARQLIKAAGQGKIRVIFEEDGEPVAAVMPLLTAEAWDANREEFFSTFRRAAERANLSEDEAEELAREAVEAIRSNAS